MKTPLLFATSIILISLIAGIVFYNAFLVDQVDPSNSPTSPTPTPIPGVELQVNHLLASPNGTISFDVSLREYDYGNLEAVFINEIEYNWSIDNWSYYRNCYYLFFV